MPLRLVTPSNRPTLAKRVAMLIHYVTLGWALTPVATSGKGRQTTGWQHRLVTTADAVRRTFSGALGAKFNIGVALGAASGGLVDVDLDRVEAVRAAPYWLPPTDRRHGRGGNPGSHHWYVTDPHLPRETFEDPELQGDAMLVELRAGKTDGTTGFFTLIPPSVHPDSGEPYEWEAEGKPATVEPEVLRRAVALTAATALLARRWTEGARNDLALAFSGALIHNGWSEADAARFVEVVARVADDAEVKDRVKTARATFKRFRAGEKITGLPKLSELIGDKVVDKLVTWLGLGSGDDAGATATILGEEVPFNDIGLALLFVDRFKDEVRYCEALGGWHVYVDGCWRRSELGEVDQRLHVVVASLWDECKSPTMSSDAKKRLARFALASGNAFRLKAALMVAMTDVRVVCAAAAFDADPWLFNCANGTLNLRDPDKRVPIADAIRRLRRDHAPADLLRKRSPVAFDPTARAPKFEKFLRRIFRKRPEVIPYLQRFVGYCLTGVTREEEFYIWHGDGANGKSQLINIIASTLGDYAESADYDTFASSRPGREDLRATRDDVIRLGGARIVTAIEAKRGRHLDETLLQEITGGDVITKRGIYKKETKFKASYKVVLCANDKPTITGDGHAIWRRVRFIPFLERIADAERILDFAKTVNIIPGELPGVLRWAVEGSLMWQREGLNPPQSILDATAEYRSEEDRLGDFFADRCVVGSAYAVRSNAIYCAYQAWAKESGMFALGMKAFGDVLRRRGYVKAKVERERGWRGLTLVTLTKQKY